MNQSKSPYYENEFSNIINNIVPKSNISLEGKTPFDKDNWGAEIDSDQELEYYDDMAFEDYSDSEFMDEIHDSYEEEDYEDEYLDNDEIYDLAQEEIENLDYEEEHFSPCSCQEEEFHEASWDEGDEEEFQYDDYVEDEVWRMNIALISKKIITMKMNFSRNKLVLHQL